jgi:hypothetical protein
VTAREHRSTGSCVALFVVATAVMAVSCRGGPDAPVTLPPELIVVDGAKDVRPRQRPDAGIEVLYRVDQPFPATELLERVRAALPSQRWHPLMEDWLNPGRATSHQRGWGSFTNGLKQPNTLVHAWSAEWKDDAGNLVLYGLVYESKYNPSLPSFAWPPPDNSMLEVTALWLPASTVNAMQQMPRSAEPVTR